MNECVKSPAGDEIRKGPLIPLNEDEKNTRSHKKSETTNLSEIHLLHLQSIFVNVVH